MPNRHEIVLPALVRPPLKSTMGRTRAPRSMMGLLGMQSPSCLKPRRRLIRTMPHRRGGPLPLVRRLLQQQGELGRAVGKLQAELAHVPTSLEESLPLVRRLLQQQGDLGRNVGELQAELAHVPTSLAEALPLVRRLLQQQGELGRSVGELQVELAHVPTSLEEAIGSRVLDTWVQSYRISERVLNTQVAQRTLAFHYRDLLNQNGALPEFHETGFRVYSQSDEDGLILYIFALIGETNRVCVEMAFGSPYGANTTNLVCNWGWRGGLFEGDQELADQSRKFFADHRDTWYYPPTVVQAWITTENVNQLLHESAITGEIDLFALDMDGVDYWIWDALDIIQPRVVIAEYNNIWAGDKCVTVPYQPSFAHHPANFDYCGASLAAYAKLAGRKGYRLVGCNRYCYNAFFVRDGIGEDVLPAVSISSCLDHPENRKDTKKRFAEAMAGPWVEV